MSDAITAHYAGRTVLVTGHTGFKGGWLCSLLLEMGARVVGLALPPEDSLPGLFTLCALEHRMHSIVADIRDPEQVQSVFNEHAPEIVFHLAAQPLVRLSYREPVTTWTTNVMGTVHLLEAARRCESVRSIVLITSDKVYENREDGRPFRESDPLGGHDPYAASKAATEIAAAAWRASFFGPEKRIALATARAGNAIGGGDWSADRIVPDVVRALIADRAVVLRNPSATRPWQHALDALFGYLLLGCALERDPATFASSWNFGPHPGDAISVSELVARIIQSWGRGRVEHEVEARAPHESGRLVLDASRAAALLAWRPRLGLRGGIEFTTRWYHTFVEDRRAVADLTAQQVRNFLAMAPQ